MIFAHMYSNPTNVSLIALDGENIMWLSKKYRVSYAQPDTEGIYVRSIACLDSNETEFSKLMDDTRYVFCILSEELSRAINKKFADRLYKDTGHSLADLERIESLNRIVNHLRAARNKLFSENQKLVNIDDRQENIITRHENTIAELNERIRALELDRDSLLRRNEQVVKAHNNLIERKWEFEEMTNTYTSLQSSLLASNDRIIELESVIQSHEVDLIDAEHLPVEIDALKYWISQAIEYLNRSLNNHVGLDRGDIESAREILNRSIS